MGGKEAPSLLALGKQAASKDARRGMAVAVGLLSVFGAALGKQQTQKHGWSRPGIGQKTSETPQ
jgi:hypothetical protein